MDRYLLADSLVSLALSGDVVASRGAITALAMAGRPSNESPFGESLTRLKAVLLESEGTVVAANAFGGLVDVTGAEAEFELIQEVVTAEG